MALAARYDQYYDYCYNRVPKILIRDQLLFPGFAAFADQHHHIARLYQPQVRVWHCMQAAPAYLLRKVATIFWAIKALLPIPLITLCRRSGYNIHYFFKLVVNIEAIVYRFRFHQDGPLAIV